MMRFLIRATDAVSCLSVSVFVSGLQGNVALEKSKQRKVFGWIPDVGWEDLMRLIEVSPDTFGELISDIEKHEKQWKEVISNNVL